MPGTDLGMGRAINKTENTLLSQRTCHSMHYRHHQIVIDIHGARLPMKYHVTLCRWKWSSFMGL